MYLKCISLIIEKKNIKIIQNSPKIYVGKTIDVSQHISIGHGCIRAEHR